jgi:hypothetical protein
LVDWAKGEIVENVKIVEILESIRELGNWGLVDWENGSMAH